MLLYVYAHTLSKKCRVNILYIIFYSFNIYIAPSVSLSFPSSTKLHIMLTAPNGSYSLTYKCTVTEIDMPSNTVTVTELKYPVDGLNPDVNYIVECMSSNGEDSCDSSMDMITRKLLLIFHPNYALYLNKRLNIISLFVLFCYLLYLGFVLLSCISPQLSKLLNCIKGN